MIRRALVLVVAFAIPYPGCAQERPSASVLEGREAFQTGAYEEAVDAYRGAALAGLDLPDSARGWALSLAATGGYEEGLVALGEAQAAGASSGDLARVRGEILRTLGRNDEAETRLREAIEGSASDADLARIELGRLLYRTGRRAEAIALFDGFIDLYNGSGGLDADQLSAVGMALGYLGRQDPLLFHDAVRAFEEAIALDPGDPEPRVRLGAMFLEKYDSPAAGQLLDEALARNPRHPEALLASARRAMFDGSSEALELARRSLEVNPRFTEARAFLSRRYLELEDVDRAEAEARTALETDPGSLEAWTELAAVAHFRGAADDFAAATRRVLEVDPSYSQLYEGLAQVAYRTHRYADAVAFAEQAIALDPTSWSGRAELGLNQLRLGRLEAGKATLETAFEGDPFNVWVKNTLDMLDEMSAFEASRSRRFVFRIHPDESALLATYAPLLAEEGFDAMSVRYGYEPPTPISVDIYDRHADFSVRTVGLTGIGALGVSFGSVLAMDSPGARVGAPFNWGSTLWHEISHAFTLGYTEHRVPRWLSEGLAVLDERHARTGWGSDVDPGFLTAFREEKLPSLERFNHGFVRPAYPGQVQHSYYMASLLCEMIEETRGFGAILRMLDGYRDGLQTPEVIEAALGLDLAGLDRELKAYIGTRFGTAIAALGDTGSDRPPGPGTFGGLLLDGVRAQGDGRTEEAIAALEEAYALFPEYAGQDAPSLLLAHLYEEQGELDQAAGLYRAYTDLNENHFGARMRLADVEERRGRPKDMREALEGAVWIDPYGPDLHLRLARSLEEAEDWTGAARERAALVALEPTDMAEAKYRLANALYRGGDLDGARSALLAALEIAPSYAEALDLLLEMRGGPGGGW